MSYNYRRLFGRRVINLSSRRYNTTKLSYRHHIGEEPLSPLTIGQQLELTCKNYGERIAIISCHQQNQRFTFNQILEKVDQLAAGLLSIGLTRNDRIGLLAPNTIEWYLTFLATARIGAILVALNPLYQSREIQYCINKVGIKTLIIGDQFKRQNYYEILKEIAPNLADVQPDQFANPQIPTLKHIISLARNVEHKGTYNIEEIFDFATRESIGKIRKNQYDISCDDPCNIQFTSGTTGSPKAALNCHFGFVNNAFFIGKRNELPLKHHKICVQVPLFHAFGSTITIMAALCHGATMVLPTDGYNPDRSLDAIKAEKCTVVHGTPTMYVDLVNKQRQRNEDISVEIAVSGGALCPPALFKQIRQILNVEKVKSVYGLTETTAVAFQSIPTDNEEQSTTTVGHIGEHVEAKVIDKEGRLVPLGQPGELCLRYYGNMLGYWGDANKTQEMIGADRWLKTGDQFILYESGYGRVVGRLKDMIIRGGENIFPKEIEDFLHTHPDILEASVFGVPHERLGEEVCVCIRLKTENLLTYDDLRQFCTGKIAPFKIPSKMKIMEKFPTTTSGKIQKFKLVEMFTNGNI